MFALVLLPAFGQTIPKGRTTSLVSYKKDVIPILKANCYACHGSKNPAEGLDLSDTKKLAKTIQPGKSDKSELILQILGSEGRDRMPIGKPPLKDADVKTLSKWIDQGAQLTDPATKKKKKA